MRPFLLCGIRVLHPAQHDLLHNHPGNRQEKKTVPCGCLAHAVIGMFYSVFANQRQPQYTYNVLQRRCQRRPTLYIAKGAGGGRTHLLLALAM